MKRYLYTILTSLMVVAALGLSPAPAAAQSLDQLRASGAVGEGADGFVRVRTPGGGAQAVADTVNAKRRAIYSKRAAEQGVALEEVGRVYFDQIINKAPAGTWYLNKSGAWVRK
ncbi:MAG TPA: DUF1318 domain-containing protein [Rhodospirillales bacterium]|nr:DUF1318 domain-containing protein [Rhodospirillales bacterium]